MKKCYLILLLLALIIILPSCGQGNVDLPKFKVDYYVDNVIYKSEEVEKGNLLTKPEDPVKEDAFFDGWYVDDEKWQFNSGIVVKDLRLDARFNGVDPNLGIVPVYQGMSASDAPNERVKLSGTKDIEDEVLPGIDVIETEGVEYFIKKGEKYLVTVHLYNPASYEILSFTLNGKKYQSFEFKEGSTSTELIIEQEAPLVSGRHDLTIDAIKYVDGTDILDVRMEGDKTITIGVTYENLPKANLLHEDISYNSYNASIELIDEAGILGENDLYIYLYDGVRIVENKKLQLGMNVIDFKNLEMSLKYQYMIVAVYDRLDSVGKKANVLYKESFNTLDGAIIKDVKASKDKVTFNPVILNNGAKLTSISLYKQNELIKSSKTLIKEFNNLLSDTAYKIVLEYQFNFNGRIVKRSLSYSFKTMKNATPTVAISNLKSTKTSISGLASIKDVDSTIESIEVELYLNDILIDSSNNKEFEFNDLLSNNLYKIEITYVYNLHNGNEAVTKKISSSIKTIALEEPSLDVILYSDTNRIDFNIVLRDEDKITNFKFVNIYDEDYLIKSYSDLDCLYFDNLRSNVPYQIKVLYTYDLNDGSGIHDLSITKTIYTKKQVPFIRVETITDAHSVNVKLFIEDGNAVGHLDRINLFKDDKFVETIYDESNRIFNNLQSNTRYTVEAVYVYDLDDGYGSRFVKDRKSFTTNKETPKLSINLTSDKHQLQ